MRFRARYLGKAVLIVAGVGVLGWAAMVLWNAVIPGVFIGVRPIDYRHALGLLLLSRILFGGFRGRGGWHRGRCWRKWEAMTPEERAQFPQNTGSRSRTRAHEQ